ncbi:hypothetical protein DRP07_12045 [Archaeoglobales archaeon]|nr:MAG: hypothetical protein DRP07_12045 [Archaeoglobales archaeon]
MKAIGIHSFKGGAGKTFLALNLAYLLSSKKNVCLVDFDLRAPSLYAFFGGYERVKDKPRYLNHLIEDVENFESYLLPIKENLSVILASPNIEEIKRDLRKKEKDEMKVLERLMELKGKLRERFDYTIFDTSPGLSYRSINSMLISDILLFVARPERIDIEGLKRLEEVTSTLETPRYVILNRVNGDVDVGINLPVIAKIPCSCSISMDEPFFVKNNPEDPVTKSIEELARFFERIE